MALQLTTTRAATPTLRPFISLPDRPTSRTTILAYTSGDDAAGDCLQQALSLVADRRTVLPPLPAFGYLLPTAAFAYMPVPLLFCSFLSDACRGRTAFLPAVLPQRCGRGRHLHFLPAIFIAFLTNTLAATCCPPAGAQEATGPEWRS